MDKLKNIKYSHEYVKDIITSEYEQNIVSKDKDNYNKEEKVYKSLEELIINVYNHIALIDSNIEGIKMEYSSNIDDDTKNFYNKFNYNSRKFNKKLIQRGLTEKNQLSTIIYLSDIYKINIYLKDAKNNITYLVSSFKNIKNKKNIYIEYAYYKYKIIDELNTNNVKDIIQDENIIINNVKNTDVYTTYLKAISNYKLNDLIKIANENDIELTSNGKKKNKNKLYDDINNKFL